MTRDELRTMARIALEARDCAAPQWLELVMTLAVRYGFAPAVSERLIEELAK